MNFKSIEDYMVQFPIYQYAFLKAEDIEFDENVRNLCLKECANYGKSWSCPPAVGSLKQCKSKCMEYTHAILFSTLAEIRDSSAAQSLQNAKKEHEEITARIEEFLHNEVLKCYTLSTDSCSLCEKCTYPKKSCVSLEQMHPCIESHGILLSKNIDENHMDYFLGGRRLLRFTLMFIKEA